MVVFLKSSVEIEGEIKSIYVVGSADEPDLHTKVSERCRENLYTVDSTDIVGIELMLTYPTLETSPREGKGVLRMWLSDTAEIVLLSANVEDARQKDTTDGVSGLFKHWLSYKTI